MIHSSLEWNRILYTNKRFDFDSSSLCVYKYMSLYTLFIIVHVIVHVTEHVHVQVVCNYLGWLGSSHLRALIVWTQLELEWLTSCRDFFCTSANPWWLLAWDVCTTVDWPPSCFILVNWWCLLNLLPLHGNMELSRRRFTLCTQCWLTLVNSINPRYSGETWSLSL